MQNVENSKFWPQSVTLGKSRLGFQRFCRYSHIPVSACNLLSQDSGTGQVQESAINKHLGESLPLR